MASVVAPSLSRTKLYRALAGAAGVLAVGLPIANAVVWLVPSLAELPAHAISALGSHPITLDLPVRLMSLAASSVGVVTLAYALFTVRQLFLRFAAGAVFEPDTGALLRRFGVLLVAYAGLTPVIRALITVFVTLHNAPGKQAIAIGFSSNEMVLALIGALFVMIGAAMADAARIADDHRQIV